MSIVHTDAKLPRLAEKHKAQAAEAAAQAEAAPVKAPAKKRATKKK